MVSVFNEYFDQDGSSGISLELDIIDDDYFYIKHEGDIERLVINRKAAVGLISALINLRL